MIFFDYKKSIQEINTRTLILRKLILVITHWLFWDLFYTLFLLEKFNTSNRVKLPFPWFPSFVYSVRTRGLDPLQRINTPSLKKYCPELYTKLYLIVRLQLWWSPECGVQLQGYYSQVNSNPDSPLGWDCRMHRLHLWRRVWLPPRSVLNLTLKCVWWWEYSYGDLRSVEYNFSAINPRSTLTQIVQSVKAVECTDRISEEG